jgi:hypothetical protein
MKQTQVSGTTAPWAAIDPESKCYPSMRPSPQRTSFVLAADSPAALKVVVVRTKSLPLHASKSTAKNGAQKLMTHAIQPATLGRIDFCEGFSDARNVRLDAPIR